MYGLTCTQAQDLAAQPNPDLKSATVGEAQTDLSVPSPTPISLLVWDQPSSQEISRSAFRGCTHTLRILSCLPPIHDHSPPRWISTLAMQALLDMRSFDAHLKVLNISFACTDVQACVCMAVKGGAALESHRSELSEFIDEGLELLWRKQGDCFYLAERSHLAKITPAHITECRHWTG